MRILSKQIADHEGEEIEMSGWVDTRRDHGQIIFIDLRDRSGVTQVVFGGDDDELMEKADNLRPEWVVKLKGKVKARPEGMVNDDVVSGGHEISATSLEILNKAETPPISVDGDGYDIGEDVRMKYRYIDLRRRRLHENIRERHKINKYFRDFLSERDFAEIETPILGKSTPEGARDYLVPSRLHPGEFYALPQSPQQYKQLLMVSGFEKYFQIARVFRDEDTRGDRQPEFTQLDIELSFTNQEEILELTENLFVSMVDKLFPNKELLLEDGRIPRMTYKEAIEEYDTDRPDLREDDENDDQLAPLLVVDFPAFEYKEGDERWGTMHHPFTQPQVDDVGELESKFEDDPSSILAYQYDLVLNGYEVAGGSMRIHNSELLRKVFELLDHNEKEIDDKFGHLMEAFRYGTPPHGGIAFGLDRIFAVMFDEPNIREVIAFPKTGDGRDLMMDAPSKVDEEQLEELHIDVEVDDED